MAYDLYLWCRVRCINAIKDSMPDAPDIECLMAESELDQ
jgi:hypothetical protein